MKETKLFIRKLDMFSQPFTFEFQGQSKFSTTFGGILSSLMILGGFGIFVSLIIEFFSKKHLKANTTLRYDEVAPYLTLTDEFDILAYQVVDKNFKSLYDESYFSMSLSLFSRKVNSTGNATLEYFPLRLERCEKQDFKFERSDCNFKNLFKNMNLKNAFCHKFANSSTSIGGSYSSKHFKNIMFELKKCENGTNIICQPMEKIDNRIKNSFFEFYFTNTYVNAENYTSPFESFLDNYFINLDPSLNKVIDFYYKASRIITFKESIIEVKNELNSIEFHSVKESIITNNSNTFLTFYVNSSNFSQTISRSYMKLDELIGILGGIYEIMFLFGNLVSGIVNKFKKYQIIMNTLYNFEVNDTIFKYNNSRKISEYNLKSILSSFYFHKEEISKIQEKNESTLKENQGEENFQSEQKIIKDMYNDKLNCKIPVSTSPKENNNYFEVKNTFNQNHSLFEMNNNEKEKRKNADNTVKKLYSKNEIYDDSMLKNMQNEASSNIYGYKMSTLKKTIPTNYKKEILTALDNNINNNKSEIKLSYLTIFGVYFCSCCITKYRNEKSIFKSVEKEMKKYLDYLEVIKLLQEFTKLKGILFNTNQNKVFSMTTKPKICHNATMKNNYLHGKIFHKEVSMDEQFESYKQLYTSESIIDAKIISFLDDDVRNCFNLLLKDEEKSLVN